MCLKDLRDEFIYDCECRHLAKGSLRNYKAATRFLLEYLELKQITELEDVRPRHIRDLMKEKRDAGSTSRYINDLLKVWRTWFNYLVNEGYIEDSLDEFYRILECDCITAAYPWADRVALVTDDNGGFTEKSFSRYIPELEQPIKGNFFLCGLGEENFTELPENLIRKYTERFWGPEAFVSMFGQMSIIRMDDGTKPE